MNIKKFILLLIIFIICVFVLSPLIFSDNLEYITSSSPPNNEEDEEAAIIHNPDDTHETKETDKTNPAEGSATEILPEEEDEEPEALPSRGKYETWDDDSLLETLSFLQSPLPGAKITTRDSQLPGAPRSYRNGIHEGLDFYEGYCGINVNYGDPVFAAGQGIVYRIDHDYIELPIDERKELLEYAWQLDDTPADILDLLRGRQVWLKHPHGIITRYAHLEQTAENLAEGDTIEAGDFIGTIGNSGTNEGAEGNTLNAHLHFEIWVGDRYLGEGLSPAEIRALWKKIIEK